MTDILINSWTKGVLESVGAEKPVGLLPCPFCGGTKVKTFGPYGWYRQWGISHSCEAFYSGTSDMMAGFPSEAQAMAAWNTRALPLSDSLTNGGSSNV